MGVLVTSLGPRHILSLSGGKDSTALAIHLRDRIPNMEYVFMDTGEELPETYEYLDRLQAYLSTRVVVLKNMRYGFSDLLRMRNGYLPSPQARWCTEYLKIRPFEEYIGDDEVVSYIAIRYDERHRKGYISNKKGICTVYPFIEENIDLSEVNRILDSSGLGLPKYYKWRSRSGCYFCFFQRKSEWVGLLKNHPHLYWKAADFEKVLDERSYTWNAKESLRELADDRRTSEIMARASKSAVRSSSSTFLLELLGADSNEDNSGCNICHL